MATQCYFPFGRFGGTLAGLSWVRGAGGRVRAMCLGAETSDHCLTLPRTCLAAPGTQGTAGAGGLVRVRASPVPGHNSQVTSTTELSCFLHNATEDRGLQGSSSPSLPPARHDVSEQTAQGPSRPGLPS